MFVLSQCTKDSSGKIEIGYDYFPYKVGTWHLYEVDSIYWDDFTGLMHEFKFYILEVVESEFYDAENKKAYRLERYYKYSDTSSWQLKDVWFFNIYPSMVQKVEENIRYIKLVFPIREGIRWDGNAMNNLKSEFYSYSHVNKPYIINSLVFDSTVKVLHSNQSNLIEDNIRYEIYAKNIGMIYKFHRTVQKDYITGSVKKGKQVILRIKLHGMR